MTKYEQLIDMIINENEDKARELFHQIVVEKSREIYESLMDEEDISDMQADVDAEEQFEDDAEFDGAEEPADDGFSDEAEADVDADMGGEEEFDGDDMGGEGDVEDRVQDLESALDDLKAQFDELMGDQDAGDEGSEEEFGSDEGSEEEAGEEEFGADDMGAEEEPAFESKQARKMTEAEWIREYVEKVSAPAAAEEGDGSTGPVATKNPAPSNGAKPAISKGGNANPDGTGAPSADKAGKAPVKGALKNAAGNKAKQEAAPKAVSGDQGAQTKSPVIK